MSIYCDGDAPDFYRCEDVVARKEHACCECSAKILVGEKHYRCVGKWEGDITTHRQHTVCGDACMLIRDKLEGECIAFGSLLEYHGEFGEDIREWAKNKDHKRHASAKQLRNLMVTILKRRRQR